MMHQLVQHRLFLAEGEHGHAVHLALQHAAHATGQHDRVAVRAADQNFISVGDRDLFKALDQLGEEGVGNVFNDDAQQAAVAGNKGARMGIGKIIQLVNRLPNALLQPVTYR
jgi:hypothetical protein